MNGPDWFRSARSSTRAREMVYNARTMAQTITAAGCCHTIMCYVIGRTQEAGNDVSPQNHQRMIDEGIPRRELLKVSAASALTFGTSLPATAQTSTMRQASPTSSISSAEPADLILKNAKVISVDPQFTIAQAVAIAGDRILAVGTDAAMAAHTAPWTRVLDLNGKTIIPGLIDGH